MEAAFRRSDFARGQFVTLRDAATLIIALPKSESELLEWKAANEALMLAADTQYADTRGLTMFARSARCGAQAQDEAQLLTAFGALLDWGKMIPPPHSQRNGLLFSTSSRYAAGVLGGTRMGTPMVQSVILGIVLYLTPSVLLLALLTCREQFDYLPDEVASEQPVSSRS